ncbi:MAG: acyltransferase [Bacteroidaceae bacterium]|nr:acyltransferase [Bacteroidaceae bacterium]
MKDLFVMISTATSEKIKSLRLPLTIAIVILHAYSATKDCGLNCFTPIVYVFSLLIGEMGVPAFFVISGYLFFQFDNKFIIAWKRKISTRVKTLLIPYLLWNLLTILAMSAVGLWQDTSLEGFIMGFWDKGSWNAGNGTPALPPFWYIRNLIVLCACSPLIYILLKYTKFLLPLLSGLLWFFTPGLAFLQASIFFFSLGAFMALRKIDFVLDSPPPPISSVKYWFIILLILDIAGHFVLAVPYVLQIHRLCLLSGVFLLFTLPHLFLRSKKMEESSFFLFALHYPIYIVIPKFMSRFEIPNDFISVHLLYFALIFIALGLSYSIYWFVKLLCPRLAVVLSGGR